MSDNDTRNPDSIADVYEAIRATDGSGASYHETEDLYPYALPQAALSFDSIADMRRQVIASGSHYFDRDAIRFFRGRTDPNLYGDRFWVESKQFVDSDGWAADRVYQVAYVSDYNGNLSVEKVGYFLTLDLARQAAKNLARVVTLNTQV